MKISEIFHSIEGEGIEIGKPEIFIRLTGCNLRCEWCDTAYVFKNGDELNIQNIIHEIKRYRCKNISITGGEPLIQNEAVLKLVKKLKTLGYWIQINTNGTIYDKEIFRKIDLISMDCKCPSSGEESDTDVLEKTKNLFNHNSQFKFVISNLEDYKYAKSIINSTLIDAENIILQPEWKNRKKITKELIEKVKNENLKIRIICQQHKLIDIK